ncbi:outer membrane beta-barrel protein [Thiothrix eikelboomii]|uniref:OmpA-like transmembrane domain-containing protein n=1 Tax=Thiothrix eikelboomii TaxID=92487 RepID=A0A1T4W8V8_9GAMM|nr:outer membrane beta-barrel protein [Thiothrix eikelboomii]SKA73706.1 OmpA-like transmembrane domain-containing protein [Thiothrix eikelboomii]
MKKYLLGSALALLLAQGSVFAYDYSYTEDTYKDGSVNFYVGAGLGILGGDSADACDKMDLNCFSWKTFVGYRPLENFALEGGYHNLFSGRSQLDGTKVESTGLSASALAIHSLKDNIDLFGKLGFLAWEARTDGIAKADGTDMLLGGGVQSKLTENIGLRGEVEYVGGDLDSTNYSAGLTYSTF